MRGDGSPDGESIALRAPAADTAAALAAALPDDGLLALLAAPLAAAPSLRVAVLVAWDAPTLWASRQVAALLAAAFVDLSIVRVPQPRARLPGAYAAYHALCTRRATARDPLSPAAWPAAAREHPWFGIEAVEDPGRRIDVVLDLAGGAHGRALASAARCGAWEYRHGTERRAASCFAEIERGAVLTRAQLVARPAGRAQLVLAEGTCATTPSPSVALNRAAPYWATEHFALQKLRELHGRGWRAVCDRARAPAAVADDDGTAVRPRPLTSARVLRWAAGDLARRAVRRVVRTRTLTDWCVALRRCGSPLPARAPDAALDDARYLPSPVGRFFADPFLAAHDGRTWLFVEDYAFDRARGAIACGEVLADGTVHELRTCLERPHHVSYPNVFWHDGSAWMVPESEQSGTVDLYRATAFPHEWRRECTLLRLRCVDPTPFPHEGRWWLYATHVPVRGVDVTTLLFTAPTLHGPWRLHEQAPVVVDVRRSRCAGAPFVHAGRLLRPAQDGTRHYGRALVLNEVRRLDPDAYDEAPVRRFEPPARLGIDGLHHYSCGGEWEAFDVRLQSPARRFAERPARDAAGRMPPTTLAGAVTPRR